MAYLYTGTVFTSRARNLFRLPKTFSVSSNDVGLHLAKYLACKKVFTRQIMFAGRQPSVAPKLNVANPVEQ